eukprot:Opistho-2@8033
MHGQFLRLCTGHVRRLPRRKGCVRNIRGKIMVWPLESGASATVVDGAHADAVTHIAWAAKDGSQTSVGLSASRSDIKTWTVTPEGKWTAPLVLDGESGGLSGLGFGANGDIAWAPSHSANFRIASADNKPRKVAVVSSVGSHVTACAVAPHLLLAHSSESLLNVRVLPSGRLAASIEIPRGSAVYRLASDGNIAVLAGGSSAHVIRPVKSGAAAGASLLSLGRSPLCDDAFVVGSDGESDEDEDNVEDVPVISKTSGAASPTTAAVDGPETPAEAKGWCAVM